MTYEKEPVGPAKKKGAPANITDTPSIHPYRHQPILLADMDHSHDCLYRGSVRWAYG